MSLRAISVRARNLLGFGLLGLILLTTGLVALKQINVLRQDVLDIRDGWMEGLDAMGQIKAARLNMRLQESLALTMPDQLDLFAEEIERFKGLVQQVDRQYEATITAEEVEDRRLFNRYQEFSRAYEQALQLLGVDSQADASEIKRAYRRQLSRCHPDKLTGSGATPAQIRAATEKTRELHAAYALLRQRRR